MKRKLGINCDCVNSVNPVDTLEILKDVGFDCFFSDTGNLDLPTMTALREKADKLGLSYEFAHAPFRAVNSMWEETEETQPFMDSIKSALDNSEKAGVPKIILHASSKWNPPPMTDAGFARYDELVEYAEKRKVGMAIENLRIFDYYYALIERYKGNKYVSFCYDNGHEHCCTPEIDNIQIFAGNISCTHLHDNLGKLDNYLTVDGDLHLLPFDGNFNFEQMIRRMDKANYTGPLVLEVGNTLHPSYLKLTPEEFITTCYERVKKISEM